MWLRRRYVLGRCTGDWVIHILQDNENIDGSPFSVRVYDPARVKVFGLQDAGETGGPIQFSGQTQRSAAYATHAANATYLLFLQRKN